MFEITSIDGRDLDEAAAAQLAELETLAVAEVLPDDPPVPPAEVLGDLRDAPAHQEHTVLLAREPGAQRLAGAGLVQFEHVEDNQHLAYVDLWVRPEHRRRGLGRELLAGLAAATATAEEHRTTLLSAPFEGTTGTAFAEYVGAEAGIVEHLNRLRTADVDRAVVEGWVERAADRAAGYSLVAFDDRCPDDLLEDFAALYDVMNDAPMSDVMEDWVVTPARVREVEASRVAQGERSWTLVAREDATGALAGLTELRFPAHRPWLAEQEDTGVEPAHRERGLGRWLKAVNVLRLLDERPEVTTVDTGNAGTNAAMLGINHALGFRRVAAYAEYSMPTSAAAALGR